MLTSLSHGSVAVPSSPRQASKAAVTKSDLHRIAIQDSPGLSPEVKQRLAYDAFDYMFAQAAELPEDPHIAERLDALGKAMVADELPGPSGLASILTFFGQFIDHDITANTDREPDDPDLKDFSINVASLTQVERERVKRDLSNLRRGTLRLDSLYGDPILATNGQAMLDAMRDGDRMLMGYTPAGNPVDLPRFSSAPHLEPDLKNIHGGFGAIMPGKIALIGDGRNDENLLVAQMHVAMLRLHNAMVDTGMDFATARKFTEWVYQWLIVNAYLPALCDDDALAKVMQGTPAELYSDFARGKIAGDSAPLPLEFSVAAFRHGHSMVRDSYRLNSTANRDSKTPGMISTARDIFERTGRGGLGGADTLEDDWVIDWANFVDKDNSSRAALPIDGALARGLGKLANEPEGSSGLLQHLAKRNLRRGYVLNLPTAQALIASIPKDRRPVQLNHQQLRAATGGDVLEAQGFLDATPLWYYILVEAEILGAHDGGSTLGPLGTMIVAETLVGLIVTDDTSYWHSAPGGRDWNPEDSGLPIDGFDTMLKFAGLL